MSEPLNILPDHIPARLRDLARRATPREFDVWLRMGERLADGMPFADAERLFDDDLAAVRAQS